MDGLVHGKPAATAKLAAARFCDDRRNCNAAVGVADDVGGMYP